MSKDLIEDIKLTFIIPTKGRLKELNTLLASIGAQKIKPYQAIILDAGNAPLKERIAIDNLPIKYIYTGPNSLTEARNIGIQNIPEDSTLAGFLDDDVILCEDATKKMMDFWQNAPPEIGGASFNVINRRHSRKLWVFKKLFFLGDNLPGNVLASGYQTMLDNTDRDIFTKWLPGGATVWRKEVFDEFKFDENYKGYGCMEDTDFSYGVGKKYKLILLSSAKLIHQPHPMNRKAQFHLGYAEIVNRFYFIDKHEEFSKYLFYWASLGRFIENFVFSTITLNSGYFNKALGNILGIKKVIFRSNKNNELDE